MSSLYRGRLAPSPTGHLHLGHARTFLVAWLRARAAGGSLLMRMEDLDPPRVVAGSAEAIYRDLEWLGLDWDGEAMVQSDRHDAHVAALEALIRKGAVYPCTCTRKDVAAASSAPHGIEGLGVRYPGTCRGGPSRPGRTPAMRFRLEDPPPAFTDLLLGAVDPRELGGDFVVRRADGLFAYQLAVVVDDLAQGVTEVVRGADLLVSTPRQIAILSALGHDPPDYLHVPLVLEVDGERLSKRAHSTTLVELREAGVEPEQIIGRLAASLGIEGASLGARPQELLSAFDFGRVPKEPAIVPSFGAPGPS